MISDNSLPFIFLILLTYSKYNGDNIVAIKFVNYDETDNAQKREMAISPILDHENVIKCYGHYRTKTFPRNINDGLHGYPRYVGEKLVFVMEKADCDLEQYLQDHYDMSYEERKRLIFEIVTGLVYLYNQHITLHDLKVYLNKYNIELFSFRYSHI